MHFLAQMDVHLPADLSADALVDLRAREKARVQEIQRNGQWLEIFWVAGRYANVSLFEVADSDELHQLLSTLPMWPYLDIKVTALARHPAKIDR